MSASQKILPSRLVVIASLLAGNGLLNLYSATAIQDFGPFYKQAVFMGAGALLFLLFSRIVDYRLFSRIAWPLWGVGVALLAAVVISGVVAGGSRRWIPLGFTRFQPSELVKLFTLVLLAVLAAKRDRAYATLKDLILPAIAIGVPALLILIQPDLGTAGALVLCGLVVVGFSGFKRKLLVGVLLVGLLGGAVAWNYVLQPYQRTRVLTMLNPESNPKGSGYQVIQSKITIASGGISGRGYMSGQQTQGKFLPEQHTDFAFAVWAEEWGLTGSLITILLFAGLLYELTRYALVARESLGSFLCAGAAAYIAVPTCINLLMILGWFPTVGLALPFFTYGGSHTLTSAMFLGIAHNVYLRRNLF